MLGTKQVTRVQLSTGTDCPKIEKNGTGKHSPRGAVEKRPGMTTYAAALKLSTTTAPEFIDITEDIRHVTVESQIQNGFVVVFSRHTTAAVIVNENEPLLLEDIKKRLEEFAPRHDYYRHNDFTIRTVNMEENESPNGHAHCQHLLLGSSQTIPLIEGKLYLGRWQRIFFLELDSPRAREVVVQVVGE
ncbi:MAG: YjbQ family protein [Dehalococcoidia bacterium]|nr:YjbQ family protein [Dehalococcoidia bacterium]